jgi:hypothetical protein
MILHSIQVVSILFGALVFGVFWGPWIALTRTLASFGPEEFLVIVHRMDRNLAPVMTVLFPLLLASILVMGNFAFGRPLVFALAIAAFVLFALSLVVTATTEVPIVTRIRDWTLETLPADWQVQRDRWISFHLLRVIPGFAGLAALATAAALT